MSPGSGAKPLTSSYFYILMALADGERHGLGIAEEVESRTDGEVELGPGTLYAAIEKLAGRGLIEESDDRPGPEEDSRRRYYRITEEGRRALEAEASRIERVLRAVRDKEILPESSS